MSERIRDRLERGAHLGCGLGRPREEWPEHCDDCAALAELDALTAELARTLSERDSSLRRESEQDRENEELEAELLRVVGERDALRAALTEMDAELCDWRKVIVHALSGGSAPDSLRWLDRRIAKARRVLGGEAAPPSEVCLCRDLWGHRWEPGAKGTQVIVPECPMHGKHVGASEARSSEGKT